MPLELPDLSRPLMPQVRLDDDLAARAIAARPGKSLASAVAELVESALASSEVEKPAPSQVAGPATIHRPRRRSLS